MGFRGRTTDCLKREEGKVERRGYQTAERRPVLPMGLTRKACRKRGGVQFNESPGQGIFA